MIVDTQKVNALVRTKTVAAVARLKDEQSRLGMKHGSDPLTKIAVRYREKEGMTNRISFKFKKSGIFVHKGVGRGTNAAEVGLTNRKAKEWFNPVIEAYADDLTEAVADEFVEATFRKLRIK